MRVFMAEYLGLQPDEKTEKLSRDNGELVSHFFSVCNFLSYVLLTFFMPSSL